MMDTIKLIKHGIHDRRRLLTATAGIIAAAQLTPAQSASAQLAVAKTTGYASFAPLKQIDAGTLNVGYAEAGLADGPAACGFRSIGCNFGSRSYPRTNATSGVTAFISATSATGRTHWPGTSVTARRSC